MAEPVVLLPLSEYDKIIVAFSGGKDSLAVILRLLDLGIDRKKLEIWHHRVDGHPSDPKPWGLEWDWRVTDTYVTSVAEALGIPLYFSWRVGGISQEMIRRDSPTADVWFEAPGPGGERIVMQAPPSSRPSKGTRLKFPAVSMDLSTRWCSAYVKIDVASRALNNRPDLLGKKILFCTGERREEGKITRDGKTSGRAAYLKAELHRTSSGRKLVHQWRPIIDWSAEDVWGIIRHWKIRPHPAYFLGWGRVSCELCIFQTKPKFWATIKELDPERLEQMASVERELGHTLYQRTSIKDLAAKGQSFLPPDVPVWFLERMMAGQLPWPSVLLEAGEEWVLPIGALAGGEGGPT